MPPEIEVTEGTQIETPAVVEAPVIETPEPETPPAPTPGEGEPSAEGEEAPPAAPAAYKAKEKFKYHVFETGEQKEEAVPELLKQVMKDPESEKQVLELLEKAYGLEPVKASRAEVQKERDSIKTELTSVQTQIANVRRTFQRGDIDGFLDQLRIPQERMLQWALDKVNYSQLPPEQQKIVDERRDAQRQQWAAEENAQTAQSQSIETVRSAKAQLLDAGLARPDVQSFAAAYDAQVGKPGAFRDEVCAQGDLAWSQSQGKVDLTPQQAIEKAMAKWNKFIQVQAPAPATPAAATVLAPATPAAKPSVIPNLQGKSSSPLKAKPKSIDDLRKLRDQANTG